MVGNYTKLSITQLIRSIRRSYHNIKCVELCNEHYWIHIYGIICISKQVMVN